MSDAAEQPDPNVVLVRDQQQRELLRAMMNRLPALVTIVGGAEHRIQYLNQAAATVFGERARPGLALGEAVPELRGQELLAALDAVRATGEAVQVDEGCVRLRHPGTERLADRYFTFVVQPLRDPEGEILGSVLHAVEVSAQVRARQEAEALARENAALYEEATTLLRLREELLNTLAHDFRAPLTAIQTGLQLVARQAERDGTVTTTQVAAVLAPVGTAVTRLNAMLSELEDLARVQAGQPLELHLAPTDLLALVTETVAMQQLTSRRHQLAIVANGPRLVGQWDGPRLERVVANLLGNAIRYSPQGGPVTVALGRDEERDEVVLTVEDSGIGIPAADLPRVFERFYRSLAVVGRMRGSGLGLASVREIVEQHGGHVTIASVEGQGTTVAVRLPFV